MFYQNSLLPTLFKHLEFYPGEVTILTGDSATGKTQLCTQIMLNFIKNQKYVFLHDWIGNKKFWADHIARQALGQPVNPEIYPFNSKRFEYFKTELDKYVTYEGHRSDRNNITFPDLENLSQKLSAIFVDSSWDMKINWASRYSITEGFQLAKETAKKYDCHYFIVHPSRKCEVNPKTGYPDHSKDGTPSKILGRGATIRNVDNILIIHKIDRQALMPESRFMLKFIKHANNGWTGEIPLRFNGADGCFYELQQKVPIHLF